METITEAKQFLRENFKKGVSCPCCDQYVRLYRRTITSTMAQQLILLYRYFQRHPEEEFVHVSTAFADLKVPPVVKSGMGDFTKLEYWGLIKHAKHLREDGSDRNGFWGITEDGKQFALGRMSVPLEMYVYDGKVKATDGPMVTIHDAKRNKFSYEELMETIL